MITKEEAVQKAVELSREHKNLVLQWATGIGKSKAAIEIIREYKTIPKVLLVVAETAHKKNWYDEFDKWDALHLFKYCHIDCYASLKNHKHSQYDLVILDEGHHSGTDIRLDILNNIKTDKLLILSATLKREVLEGLELIFGKLKLFNIGLTQAIEAGLLPTPKIYLIPLKLSDNIDKHLVTMERGKKEKRKVIKCSYSQKWVYLKDKVKYPDLTLVLSCTALEKYTHLTEQFEYYKKQYFITRQEHLKNKWLRTGSERKRFLGDSKSKIVLSLLQVLKPKRYICFCSSIEQAVYLGGENAIHSERSDSLNVIDRFNKGEINHLFAVNMLQEGQNLNDIDAGIIVQLDGQERAFVQKFGRTLRADSPEQYIFYYKGTRDEEYLENVLEDIDKGYVFELENIDELVEFEEAD